MACSESEDLELLIKTLVFRLGGSATVSEAEIRAASLLKFEVIRLTDAEETFILEVKE